MSAYSVEQYANLCALTYFDIPDFHKKMSLSTYLEQCSLKNVRHNDFYRRLYEEIMQSDFYPFLDLTITDYVNENHESGLVFYQLEDEDDCYLVFRGSEAFDTELNCGWEDWMDNLGIWLGITNQQLRALKYFNALKTKKRLHLIGHSKGGNLALFLSCVCSSEKLAQIEEVVAFNAPGINQDMMEMYADRINDEQFKKKITCVEKEMDVISSMFFHVKEPLLVASQYKGISVNEAYESHQLWAYEKIDGHFVMGTHKSVLARLSDLVSNRFVNRLDEESKKKLIHRFMDYCQHECTLDEMYHVILYNIGLHQNLFREDEDFKSVEIQTLFSAFQRDVADKIIAIPTQVKSSFDDIKIKVKGWIGNENVE